MRRGELAATERQVGIAARSRSGLPAWHAVHGATLRAGGRPEEAIAAVRRFRSGYEAGATRAGDVGLAMTIVACSALGGELAAVASALRRWATEQLTLWSGQLIVVGSGAACFGPVDLYLALGRTERPELSETWAGAWSPGNWGTLAEQIGAVIAAPRTSGVE